MLRPIQELYQHQPTRARGELVSIFIIKLPSGLSFSRQNPDACKTLHAAHRVHCDASLLHHAKHSLAQCQTLSPNGTQKDALVRAVPSGLGQEQILHVTFFRLALYACD